MKTNKHCLYDCYLDDLSCCWWMCFNGNRPLSMIDCDNEHRTVMGIKQTIHISMFLVMVLLPPVSDNEKPS